MKVLVILCDKKLNRKLFDTKLFDEIFINLSSHDDTSIKFILLFFIGFASSW